jgi:hypothetical protein
MAGERCGHCDPVTLIVIWCPDAWAMGWEPDVGARTSTLTACSTPAPTIAG